MIGVPAENYVPSCELWVAEEIARNKTTLLLAEALSVEELKQQLSGIESIVKFEHPDFCEAIVPAERPWMTDTVTESLRTATGSQPLCIRGATAYTVRWRDWAELYTNPVRETLVIGTGPDDFESFFRALNDKEYEFTQQRRRSPQHWRDYNAIERFRLECYGSSSVWPSAPLASCPQNLIFMPEIVHRYQHDLRIMQKKMISR